jgi:FAD-dependent urate hydroxylase
VKDVPRYEEGMKAIVIGAGVGGPVMGMWLRRIGADVVVAEARHNVARSEGAFLGLAPNGMHVLDALGLADAIAREGHACDAFWFLNAKGDRIGTIDRSGDRARLHWPLTMVRRGRLHELLADAAVQRGVELHFGKRLAAVERGAAEVHARFDDGTVVVGDVLLGCDGLRSTVRAQVMPDAPAPRFSGLLDYGGFARIGAPFPPGVNVMVFGRRAFFGSFTTPAGDTWWFHNGPPGGEEADSKQRLLELHRDDPSWIRDLIEATPEVLGPWPLHELDAMKRWSDGRVCLLGDAAHAMSPSAGQGAALALEDAMVLARCLRDVDDPARAFAAFERERRPRVDAIARQARRNSNGKADTGPVAAWFRDRMLKLFLPLAAAGQTRTYAHRVRWEAA